MRTSPPGHLPRSIVALAAALLLAGAAPACSSVRRSPAARSDPGRATVVRVVDGDTVVIDTASGREKVRLIGVDTPETVKPDTPVECFGPEASAHLGQLLPAGTPVRVARDVEARDRYGRLLAYLWRLADGRFVNLDIAAGGYGRPLAISPNLAHRADFAEASGQARRDGRGLWASCPP